MRAPHTTLTPIPTFAPVLGVLLVLLCEEVGLDFVVAVKIEDVEDGTKPDADEVDGVAAKAERSASGAGLSNVSSVGVWQVITSFASVPQQDHKLVVSL